MSVIFTVCKMCLFPECCVNNMHAFMCQLSECLQLSSFWRNIQFQSFRFCYRVINKYNSLSYQEDTLVLLAAQKYFVDNGADIKEKSKFEETLLQWLPEESKKGKSTDYWSDKVSNTIKSELMNRSISANSLKSDIVIFAMNKWSSMFSRFYDAHKITGPTNTWNDVIIGLNCKGINVMDESEVTKIQIPFVEVASVVRGR